MEFRDKVAVVVGGSSGIGRALVLRLADAGARVVVTARRAERLDSLAAEIQRRGGRCSVHAADAQDGAAAQRVVQACVAEHGRIDLLVLNAGGAPALDMRRMQAAAVLTCMRSNYDVAVNFLFPVLHRMRAQGDGVVAVTNSLAGLMGVPLQGPYSAAKGALKLRRGLYIGFGRRRRAAGLQRRCGARKCSCPVQAAAFMTWRAASRPTGTVCRVETVHSCHAPGGHFASPSPARPVFRRAGATGRRRRELHHHFGWGKGLQSEGGGSRAVEAALMFGSARTSVGPAFGRRAPLAGPPSLGLHRGAGEHDVDICSPALHGHRQLIELQRSDGAWEGEVVWGPVVTAQVVIATALVGQPQARGSDERIGRYLLSLQNDDGGWGLNFRTASQLFATTLVYVALRLLGLEAGASEATRARRWLRAHPDGVAAIPTWGKMWLAFLGLYPYEGIHPMPVEIALLRGRVNLVSRVYCHTRYIYLAMANLRSRRFVAPVALAAELRGELYGEGGMPDPGRCRGRIAATDLFLPPSRWLRLAYAGLRVIEPLLQGALAAVRRAALAHTAELLRDEVESSGGECLSPVNGVLALLALHTTGCAGGPAALLADKLDRWAWDDAGGRRFAGARSQTWDTALALQSLLEFRAAASASAPASAETDRARWACALRSGYRYLVERQVRREPASRLSQRQAARGGWCFNDGTHGWPVADCTAEAIIAIAGCHRMEGLIPVHERIGAPWLERAARFILSRQNRDGGFGSYESRRAPAWIEKLAPAEMFGECMTDGSCIECTASCVEALVRLRELTDDSRSAIDSAIARGLRYLRSGQNPDGSFNGTWGINYLYATYFAMRALSAAGASARDPAAGRALQWVRSKQRADGGWGEHAASLREGRYVEHERSLIASTSWAVLAMLSFGEVERTAARGVRWLLAQRDRNGHWLPDGANGAFFGSATLEYRCYNPIFATRAVARYAACGATP